MRWPFEKAESSLKKWRQHSQDRITLFNKVDTMPDFVRALLGVTGKERVEIPFVLGKNMHALRWMTINVGEATHIAFFDEKLMELIGPSIEYNLDGTFKFKPNIEKCMQLLTMKGHTFGKVNQDIFLIKYYFEHHK